MTTKLTGSEQIRDYPPVQAGNIDALLGLLDGAQPLDSDLTAIAALSTTTFGRSLLTQASAAALRDAIDVYSRATVDGGFGRVVTHGSTGGTARPTSSLSLLWVGTVEPTNANNGDRWLHSSSGLERVKVSGAFVAVYERHIPKPIRDVVAERFAAYDDFAGPVGTLNNAPDGGQWTLLAGTWRRAGADVRLVTEGIGNYAATRNAQTADGVVRATIKFNHATVGNAGVVVRAIDADNYLFVRCVHGTDQLLLRKLDGGADSNLGGNPGFVFAEDQEFTLEVRCEGNKVRVSVDGSEVINHTLSTANQDKYGAATRHGLYARTDVHTLFRDFAVERLAQEPAGGGGGTAPAWLTNAIAVLFPAFDDFEGSAGDLGVAADGGLWASLNGQWTLDGDGNAKMVTGGTGDYAAVRDAEQADGLIRATIKFNHATVGNAGVVVRAQDAANYLYVRCVQDTDQVLLRKLDGGSDSNLGGDPGFVFTASQEFTLEVRAEGDSVKVLVDGAVVIDHTLSAGDQTKYGSNALHGLYARTDVHTLFRDFAVERLAR